MEAWERGGWKRGMIVIHQFSVGVSIVMVIFLDIAVFLLGISDHNYQTNRNITLVCVQ